MQWVAVPWPATHTLQSSTQPPSVETHTYSLVKMSGKMENHRERGVIKRFTRFSSKDATSSGTWVFRVECLDCTCSLSHSGYRSQGYLRMLLLLCCLDTLPKKYRFPSQPVGGDDNNNNGATHGGQRMSSGSGGGGGGDLIPVWCGSVVCGSSRRWEVDCPQPARRLQENTGRRSSLQSANNSSADQWQGL